jgi:hypothetical protein
MNETDDAGLNNKRSDFWVLGLLLLGVEWRKMVAYVDSVDCYDEEGDRRKTQRFHLTVLPIAHRPLDPLHPPLTVTRITSWVVQAIVRYTYTPFKLFLYC